MIGSHNSTQPGIREAPCPNCNGTKRALYFSEQRYAHEMRDCHICRMTPTTPPEGDDMAREAVAWQFRQRSGVGKGPQSQAPWCDWCGIEREDYERYIRETNPLIQVRALYATPHQSFGVQNASVEQESSLVTWPTMSWWEAASVNAEFVASLGEWKVTFRSPRGVDWRDAGIALRVPSLPSADRECKSPLECVKNEVCRDIWNCDGRALPSATGDLVDFNGRMVTRDEIEAAVQEWKRASSPVSSTHSPGGDK